MTFKCKSLKNNKLLVFLFIALFLSILATVGLAYENLQLKNNLSEGYETPPPKEVTYSNPQDLCKQKNGVWLDEYSECQNISEAACTNMGGSFEGCASPCRHNPKAELCATVCVAVCSFNNLPKQVITTKDSMPKHGYSLNSINLVGNILTLNVSYSGGCEEHVFELVLGTQTDLYLSHNANGDRCEAYLTENLKFDLSPIKVTPLNFYDFDNNKHVLDYQFVR